MEIYDVFSIPDSYLGSFPQFQGNSVWLLQQTALVCLHLVHQLFLLMEVHEVQTESLWMMMWGWSNEMKLAIITHKQKIKCKT